MKALALFFALVWPALPSPFSIVGEVSQSSYEHYLSDDLYAYTGNRNAGPNHNLARTNIVNDFTAMGLTATLDPFTYGGTTYNNVVAVLPGAGSRAGDIYVVGAHFDSVNAPGADDNASGVAGVLEAARVLSQHNFYATLIFIAFDREEQGLIGSNAYVDSHLGLNILGMISLDMIAYNAAAGVAGHNQAAIWGAAASLPIRRDLAAAVTTYSGGLTPVDRGSTLDCCSDQRAFENHGFQGALLIENSSNPYYHTTSDSLNTAGYIDFAFATGMTRAAVGYLAEHAEETPEPATAFTVVLAGLLLFAARRHIRCR